MLNVKLPEGNLTSPCVSCLSIRSMRTLWITIKSYEKNKLSPPNPTRPPWKMTIQWPLNHNFTIQFPLNHSKIILNKQHFYKNESKAPFKKTHSMTIKPPLNHHWSTVQVTCRLSHRPSRGKPWPQVRAEPRGRFFTCFNWENMKRWEKYREKTWTT